MEDEVDHLAEEGTIGILDEVNGRQQVQCLMGVFLSTRLGIADAAIGVHQVTDILHFIRRFLFTGLT